MCRFARRYEITFFSRCVCVGNFGRALDVLMSGPPSFVSAHPAVPVPLPKYGEPKQAFRVPSLDFVGSDRGTRQGACTCSLSSFQLPSTFVVNRWTTPRSSIFFYRFVHVVCVWEGFSCMALRGNLHRPCIQTEIIPLCLRIMETGSELSKTVCLSPTKPLASVCIASPRARSLSGRHIHCSEDPP